jgi:CheY-like chemotaxis protein
MAERRSLVLCVDDDPADLALLRKLIPRLGYAAIEASTGSRCAAGYAANQSSPACPSFC